MCTQCCLKSFSFKVLSGKLTADSTFINIPFGAGFLFALGWFSVLLKSKDMSTLSSDIAQRTKPSERVLTSVDSDVERSWCVPISHSFLSDVRKWAGRYLQQLCESELILSYKQLPVLSYRESTARCALQGVYDNGDVLHHSLKSYKLTSTTKK